MRIYESESGYTDARRMAEADAITYNAPQLVLSQAGAQTRNGWRYATRGAMHGAPLGWGIVDTIHPPRPLRANVTLSTGAVVTHSRMANGAQAATVIGRNAGEFTPAEHAEYLKLCEVF